MRCVLLCGVLLTNDISVKRGDEPTNRQAELASGKFGGNIKNKWGRYGTLIEIYFSEETE